jgi:hypothetical protein
VVQPRHRHARCSGVEELRSSPEAYVRGAAERALAQLAALDAIDGLEPLIARFQATTGRPPAAWIDLVRAGLLPGLPADATGAPFVYDAATGRVSLDPDSSLAPLPPVFARR